MKTRVRDGIMGLGKPGLCTVPEILGGKALEESKGLESGALERKPERLEGGAFLRSRAPRGKLGELESWALGEKPERLEVGPSTLRSMALPFRLHPLGRQQKRQILANLSLYKRDRFSPECTTHDGPSRHFTAFVA